MNQTELAKKVGVLQSTVSSWEQGKTVPQPKNLKRIAEALSCEIADLLLKD